MAESNLYDPSICCNCGSKSSSTIASGPIVPVIRCNECKLMRQGVESDSQIKPFTHYAGGEKRFQRQREDKETIQIRDFLKIIPQLEKLFPQKGKLLEIGCAMGTFLNELKRVGWDVTGIEPETWTCNITRTKYGINAINSTFEDAGIENESFDVVLMLHVIEHLPDPAKGLKEIAKMIKPGGLLVMETPRYDTLTFKLLKGRERSVISGHTYYFTRKSIQTITQKAGLEVIRLDSVGRTVTLDRLCFYVAKFINTNCTTKIINLISEMLHFNKIVLHINLCDMMRVYLRKTDDDAHKNSQTKIV